MSDDQFDRVPPQDIDAEMSVLGSMMLTTEAANIVSEMLRGQDFYQPSHETIFDTIVELNGRAEPADAITVAGELKRAGVELDDGVEDGLVAGLVEVLPAQYLGDDVGGLGRQHHGPEDAHLRVDVLRGDAVELVVGHRVPFGSAGGGTRPGLGSAPRARPGRLWIESLQAKTNAL